MGQPWMVFQGLAKALSLRAVGGYLWYGWDVHPQGFFAKFRIIDKCK
jgi:hypothetical protein